MVSKTFIITMMLATFVLPQHTLWQWDADLDEPASWIEQSKEQEIVQNTDQEIQQESQTTSKTKQQPKSDNAQASRNSNTVAAGNLSNKIDPTTIWSYAKGGGRWSILCSTIARINLSNLTGLPYRAGWFAEGSIARGDAYTLALHGAARWQMIVTNKTSFESDIWAHYQQTNDTIFDVYFYKGSNGGIMQGHRAVVFIGTDDQVYILDPIRWQITAKPQLLSAHFAADGYRGYSMYIAKTSYQPKQQYKTIQEYYEIQESASLVWLVNDGVATVENTPLGDDTVLTINQDMRFTTDTQEIIIEKWAVITIQSTTNLIWWKLLPEQWWLKAQFEMPEFGTLTPWDR
jgi:hypothetical protein